MSSGMHSPGQGAAREGFGSPPFKDNVVRKEEFLREHREVEIISPRENGTRNFVAIWPGGELSDTSLGWLMDRLEQHFR